MVLRNKGLALVEVQHVMSQTCASLSYQLTIELADLENNQRFFFFFFFSNGPAAPSCRHSINSLQNSLQ